MAAARLPLRLWALDHLQSDLTGSRTFAVDVPRRQPRQDLEAEEAMDGASAFSSGAKSNFIYARVGTPNDFSSTQVQLRFQCFALDEHGIAAVVCEEVKV